MGRSKPGIATCPRCNRAVRTDAHRFKLHTDAAGERTCPLSTQRVPFDGHTATDYVGRAHLVADLAEQVQDADPAVVWEYLTATPAAEIQRLLIIALAAIPVDQRVEDMFAWVTELPVAKRAAS
jgi:hypothetical protein